jgi:hypothetical protein
MLSFEGQKFMGPQQVRVPTDRGDAHTKISGKKKFTVPLHDNVHTISPHVYYTVYMVFLTCR